jgi:glycosyltransferase involved in cell wall biosynthesis
MRVLFLLTQDLESPSGLGRYLPLARQLVRLGHQATVVALHPDLGALRRISFELYGVHVQYVAPMHVQKQGSEKRYYPAYTLLPLAAWATFQLGRAALCIPSDVVHIGKPHPMNSLAGLAASYLPGRRLYLDCDDDEAGSGRFGGEWQRRGVAFFEARAPHWARAITTNTLCTRTRLVESRVPADRVVYVPNGVDRERFAGSAPARVAALRAALGLAGRSVVAYVGSLNPANHPVDLLLAAFVEVRRANPRAVLLIVGGGDYAGLKRQVQVLGLSESVRFCGRVAPSQVPLYFGLADVSVDPIYDDAAARGRSPLKMFESWASGVPFVTADVGDRRGLAGEPPAALLVKPGDTAALAAAILQVIFDRDCAEALRQRGLARVEAFYWDRLVQDFVRVYEF